MQVSRSPKSKMGMRRTGCANKNNPLEKFSISAIVPTNLSQTLTLDNYVSDYTTYPANFIKTADTVQHI